MPLILVLHISRFSCFFLLHICSLQPGLWHWLLIYWALSQPCSLVILIFDTNELAAWAVSGFGRLISDIFLFSYVLMMVFYSAVFPVSGSLKLTPGRLASAHAHSAYCMWAMPGSRADGYFLWNFRFIAALIYDYSILCILIYISA